MEETGRLQKVYQLFTDSPADRIPGEKLADVIRFAGYIVSDAFVDELSQSLPDESFDFSQLQAIVARIKEREITRDELQRSFKRLDANGTSYVDAGKLVQILSSGENRFDQEELEEILSILNPDGDGRICYELVIKSIFGY